MAPRPASGLRRHRTRVPAAGESVSATAYLRFQSGRAGLRDQVLAALTEAEILATPTMPFTAPPIGATTVDLDGEPADLLQQSMRFTALPSLTGLPAVSIPCGFDNAGLPIGMRLLGRPFTDAHPLRVAAAFQRRTTFHRQEPDQRPAPRRHTRHGPQS